MSDIPDDLRLIQLIYSGQCRGCGIGLDVDTMAQWSRSTRAVWCADCVSACKAEAGFQSTSAQTTPSGSRRSSVSDASPVSLDSVSIAPQTKWERLCNYALECIDAEAIKTLALHSNDGIQWFTHSEPEGLITGEHDSTPASENMIARLNSPNWFTDGHTIIYGWPTVVLLDRDRRPKVAPLFMLQVEPVRDTRAHGWMLHAMGEPEFNIAITANALFDPSISEEVNALTSSGLPFGDSVAFEKLVEEVTNLLGLEIFQPLNPKIPSIHVERIQGVYNAAISVRTEPLGYNAVLRNEIRYLRMRNDWAGTGASHLIMQEADKITTSKPLSNPLAAPLVTNPIQEEALEKLRREPITVVTGPPGTGKTQLVVNAVANAWLDGNTVLVTSTNNSAVDAVVERAEGDIGAGLVMRGLEIEHSVNRWAIASRQHWQA